MHFWTNTLEPFLVGCTLLVFISIFISKLSWKSGIPVLVLFILIGMLAGSEGLGGIFFDNPKTAQSLGAVALAFILFSGGLETKWKHAQKVFFEALSLSTAGVALTAVLVGAFVHLSLRFSLIESMLIGSVISSTDFAAVFTILRSKNVTLKEKIKHLLEFESGLNDPMAVFLTIGFTYLLIHPKASLATLVPMFFVNMILGAIIGYGVGKVTLIVINRINLEFEGLYLVFMIAVVGFVYSVTSIAGGNGFLAVYLTGIIVGNSNFIHRKSIVKFHDGLAWLMQIAMFLTLGLLVFPSQLVPVIGSGLLISAFLIVVARPVAVFISLCFSKFSLREKAFISWVGLRGAVPIILATYPLVAGVQRADAIFNIVFFIVMTSSIIQGAFLALPAKWLGVDTEMVESAEELPNLFSGEYITNKLLEIKVPDGSKVIGKQIVEIDLPEDFQILLLSRNLKLINPIGRTVIQPGDSLLILADCNSPEKILQLGNIL